MESKKQSIFAFDWYLTPNNGKWEIRRDDGYCIATCKDKLDALSLMGMRKRINDLNKDKNALLHKTLLNFAKFLNDNKKANSEVFLSLDKFWYSENLS